MEPFGSNPFAVLTFIAAPAILTNASTVVALGTANRFARAIDRIRVLVAAVEGRDPDDAETAMRLRQLRSAQRRALHLLRAMTAFYLSVGSFAAASLISLVSAAGLATHLETLHRVALWVAFAAGVVGFGGLVAGSGLLVFETRMALRILGEETRFLLARRSGERGG